MSSPIVSERARRLEAAGVVVALPLTSIPVLSAIKSGQWSEFAHCPASCTLSRGSFRNGRNLRMRQDHRRRSFPCSSCSPYDRTDGRRSRSALGTCRHEHRRHKGDIRQTTAAALVGGIRGAVQITLPDPHFSTCWSDQDHNIGPPCSVFRSAQPGNFLGAPLALSAACLAFVRILVRPAF